MNERQVKNNSKIPTIIVVSLALAWWLFCSAIWDDAIEFSMVWWTYGVSGYFRDGIRVVSMRTGSFTTGEFAPAWLYGCIFPLFMLIRMFPLCFAFLKLRPFMLASKRMRRFWLPLIDHGYGVRISGAVSNLDTNSKTFSLLEFTVCYHSVKVPQSLANGQYVEVEGNLWAGARIYAYWVKNAKNENG